MDRHLGLAELKSRKTITEFKHLSAASFCLQEYEDLLREAQP